MAEKMRFWIPDNSRMVPDPGGAGMVPARQVDPDWWRVPVQGFSSVVVLMDGREIKIRNVYETHDPHEVRALLKCNLLRCDPEDAVLLGILPLEDAQACGVLRSRADLDRLTAKLAEAGVATAAEIQRPPEVLHREANPLPPALPDFDVMTRNDLQDWAASDDPEIVKHRMGDPIALSSTWSRERMIDRIKKTLRDRGDKRL